jgi:hypothetical protein
MNGHTDPEVDRYNAAHDPRAALAVPLLRRDLAAQQAESLALAAELESRDRVPRLREQIAAVASARAEHRRDVGELLDVLLGAA